MLNAYPYGSLIRFSVVFTNQQTSAPVDPTAISLMVQVFPNAPDEFTLADGDVIRDSAGHYHCDVLPEAVGSGVYSWKGTGSVVVATASIPFQVTNNVFSETP